MKRKHRMHIFAALIACVIMAVSVMPALAAELKLDKKELTLKVPNSLVYDAENYKVLEVKGTTAKPTWKSSNENIAVVKASSGTTGKVWPKSEGICDVTATVEGKTLTCKVIVVSENNGMKVPKKSKIPKIPSYPKSGVKEYTFTDTVINGEKKDGIFAWSVCSTDEPKIIHLRGKIYLNVEGVDRVMKIGSNTVIDAAGATITTSKGVIMTNLEGGISQGKGNYDAAKNIWILGGTWGYEGGKLNTTSSLFQFVHCSGLVFKDMTINANYKAHALEIIACKDVWIDSCKILGLEVRSASKREEQIQIDVANKKTAPNLKNNVNGHACENIYIKNNKVTGERAVCVNYDKAKKADYHKNIIIQGNELVGDTSEALMVANTVGLDIEDNTVTSNSKKIKDAESIGLHVVVEKWNAPAEMASSWTIIRNNTAKGGRQAIMAWPNVGKFGNIAVVNNKCFCKAGVDDGVKVGVGDKRKIAGNEVKKW